MGIALVPRGVRALADQLNAYYRVLKGTDPDSVLLRLNPGGRFEVRHSATAAPVFTVTDSGASVVIGTEDIADGAVNSAKILDGSIMNIDVNASAGITTGKLAHIGAGNVFKSNGTANVGGQVTNTEVSPTAAIVVSKLAGGGTANRVVATADGATMAMQQVNGSMIASGTLGNTHYSSADKMGLDKIGPGAAGVLKSDGTVITAGNQITSADIQDGAIMNADINAAAGIDGAKLLDNSVPSSKLTGGVSIPAGSIDSSHLADGAIMNVDVNASAAIAVTKVAHVGAGNVLRSNGSTNVAGQIVNGDITANTINGDAKLVASSITGDSGTSAIGAGALHVNRIQHLGANNVLKSNGSTNVPAQVMNGDIQNGTIDGSTKLADGSVTTVKITPNHVTQAAVAVGVGSGSTTSATPVQVPEMTVTLTTTGGDLLCWFSGTFSHSGTAVGIFLSMALDGVLIPGTERTLSVATAAYVHPLTVSGLATGVSAGSHTVTVRYATNAGTATANSNERSLVVMERKR